MTASVDNPSPPTYYFSIMASDRIQRQVDRLLDEAESAFAQRDWVALREHAQSVLDLDPHNGDASGFLAAAESALSRAGLAVPVPPAMPAAETPAQPSSFANARYQVRELLGEGGKKKVFLAHDTLLDRDVAFALIKTEG